MKILKFFKNKVPNWLKSIFFLKYSKHESSNIIRIKISNSNNRPQSAISQVNSDHNENQVIDDIYKMLKRTCLMFEKREKELKTSENIINEWREIARRLDSFLLWVFSIVFLIMSTMLFRKIFFYETKAIKGVCGCSSLNN